MLLPFADKKYMGLASSAARIYVYLGFDHEPYLLAGNQNLLWISIKSMLTNTSVKSVTNVSSEDLT